MERKKAKIVKFLEVEQIKEFQKPIIEEAKEAMGKNEMSVADKIAIRDFAVINLVYACALRISEACKLTLNYLDLEKKEIYVVDSKGDDRVVPIPEPTIKIIKEWLKIRPNWKNNNYVFTNIKGSTRPGKVRPLNQKYYNQLFNKLAEMTGVKMKDGSNPHPHTLRHSRAMEIYDNIDNLEILKKLLGHKNIATTQIYAQVRDSKVAEVQNTIVGGLISI
ncbi:MAG: tyrosine-type recombinase/integrase [Clostridium sp.]|nr:tyrosine-type recombinase/integrase [Clostridium sp.]